jgi:hypothetical protein
MQGRYRPLLLDSLAQAPLGTACLSLTSTAVSSTATETPFTNRTCPIRESSWEACHDHDPKIISVVTSFNQPAELKK